MRIKFNIIHLLFALIAIQFPSLGEAQTSPSPTLVSSPPYYDWGPMHSNSDAIAVTFNIENSGSSQADISSIQLGVGAYFSISSTDCGSTIQPNASCNITVVPLTGNERVHEDGVFITYDTMSLRVGLRADTEYPNAYSWYYSVTPVPGNIGFTQISTGGQADCGIDDLGSGWCWGSNGTGQLGDNDAVTSSTTPVNVYGNLSFAQISAGAEHSCGVTTSGAGYCWGENQSGQLGNTTEYSQSEIPIAVHGSIDFKLISAGTNHTCGIDVNGKAYCWGNAVYGVLGGGQSTGNYDYPTAVSGSIKFSTVAATVNISCGLSSTGAAYCWGLEQYGELGNNYTSTSNQYVSTPTPVVGGLTFAQLSVGSDHVCALTASGQAYCWGSNAHGEIGNMGSSGNYASPQPVSGQHVFVQIVAAQDLTCALDNASQTYCWGVYTGLGNGTSAKDTYYPIPVQSSVSFYTLSQSALNHVGGLTNTN